ncbi:threonine--tRNA ligase [Candidatus Methanodesulfokora washburnensis]|uniref:Threonine--tRNA ligase n=1 Tax=Candidatus Methanodesulfokora washburnensis TaxID=2478471 RepID=A0A3R9PI73_9CREN|nr:threonine--tRNA ligase [Candidatus Methanodesulfokores washburnensis]RSN74170.1 threonine--tRNA ligase [Candidatus Methanodesulfokores washburnensis]
MRILALHSDFFRFRVRQKAVEAAEEPENREGEFSDLLVLFTSFEKGDSEEEISLAIEDIKDVSSRVGTTSLLVYPWVHLTENPLPFYEAKRLMNLFAESLKKENFSVAIAPIGWYKEFEIKVKGHPLSESLRVIRAGERKAEREKEAEEHGRFAILHPDGREEEIGDLDSIADEELKIFIRNEVFGKVPSGEKPRHIELMRRLELVDYERSSDIGHFRFYPAGTLVKRLIEELALNVAISIGAMEIETPLMYRLDVPAIAEQASKFRERMYTIQVDNNQLILRFAGDFGLFEMMKDMNISYRHLPVSFYEISPSFRLEQRGEAVGLRRLRAFTMPDIHTFARDMKQGISVYKMYYEKYHNLLRELGIEYVVAFRVVERFYEELKPEIIDMLRISGKSALIEILPEMKHYWAMKHEFQFVDSTGGNAQLSTVQLDVEDSARYGIFYIDEKGERRPGIIVHTSMGSIERLIYAVLETAAKRGKKGKKPMLPLWLSPTQVRIIPVSQEHLAYAEKILDSIKDRVRADLDDREMTLSHKIRDAERKWIPYIVVVGAAEEEMSKIRVRRRSDGADYYTTPDDLVKEILENTEGMPFRRINVPERLSKRPIFVGSS